MFWNFNNTSSVLQVAYLQCYNLAPNVHTHTHLTAIVAVVTLGAKFIFEQIDYNAQRWNVHSGLHTHNEQVIVVLLAFRVERQISVKNNYKSYLY